MVLSTSNTREDILNWYNGNPVFDGETHFTTLFGDSTREFTLLSKTPYVHLKHINVKSTVFQNRVNKPKPDPTNTTYGYYNVLIGHFEKDVIGNDINTYPTQDIIGTIRTNPNTPKQTLVNIFDDCMNYLRQIIR